jgi:hypothetical protein
MRTRFWIGLGILSGIALLFLLLLGGRWLISSQQENAPAPVLTVVGFSTSTPTPTMTATPDPEQEIRATETRIPGQGGPFQTGDLVEVSGTGDDGLRIRDQAGLQGDIQFLGLENEVFEIRDGPVELDGFTWWFLVSPSDDSFRGWAAGTFLRSLTGP